MGGSGHRDGLGPQNDERGVVKRLGKFIPRGVLLALADGIKNLTIYRVPAALLKIAGAVSGEHRCGLWQYGC